MMIPLRWVTGVADQENITSLSPATTENIPGDPDGAKQRRVRTTKTHALKISMKYTL